MEQNAFPLIDDRDLIATVRMIQDTPERALCRAILQDAIEVATGIAPVKSVNERVEAREWLQSANDSWIMPCNAICAALDIDQGAMLRKIEPRFADRHVSIPKPAPRKIQRTSNYHGRAVGAINRSTRDKLPKIMDMLRAGASVRRIAAAVGATRFLVLKARTSIAAEMALIPCGCGRPAGHKGWCRYLYERSAERRRALAKLHERQRAQRAEIRDAPQIARAAGETRTFLQTDIAGR